MSSIFLTAYGKLFQFVAKKRLAKKDLSAKDIHSFLVCVLATGILMWAYAILALLTIDHPLPGIVGVVASLVHILSPLLFRINNRLYLNTNLFLGAGMIHQATFGFFCGGFYSNIIIWFGILPLLAGVVCGKKGIITWLSMSTFVSLGFIVLQMNNYPFPYLISPNGLLISQALVTFGWIFVAAIIVWVFLVLVENHQKEIEDKKEGIQNLICVITHDISTPLTVIMGRSNLLKKEELPGNVMTSIGKISNASYSISDIVNNVRNLYATELGKNLIEVGNVELIKILDHLKENFSEKLEAKEIDLSIKSSLRSCPIKANADLLLHQILGNLLSNAIKFSPEKSTITISVETKEGHAFIYIKDSGIGIPKDLLLKLFDMRSKTSRRGTSGEEGTGFGLPIVKTYVEKLDGRIDVISASAEDNAIETGTTFILEFECFSEAEKSFDLF